MFDCRSGTTLLVFCVLAACRPQIAANDSAQLSSDTPNASSRAKQDAAVDVSPRALSLQEPGQPPTSVPWTILRGEPGSGASGTVYRLWRNDAGSQWNVEMLVGDALQTPGPRRFRGLMRFDGEVASVRRASAPVTELRNEAGIQLDGSVLRFDMMLPGNDAIIVTTRRSGCMTALLLVDGGRVGREVLAGVRQEPVAHHLHACP
jgi:hypothetical protein